jgi:hypothetical protein
MTHQWQLKTGHQISVAERGGRTTIDISYDRGGQQSRSSSSFTSGAWSAPPELELTPDGGILTINTATGKSMAIVRGNSIQISSNSSSGGSQVSSSSSSYSN